MSSSADSRRDKANRCARWSLGTLTAAVVFCPSIMAQTGEQQFLIVDDPRPVAEGLHELMFRHGVVITYEDPRYLYQGDIKDVTLEVRRDLSRFPPGEAPKILVPFGGRLDFSYALSRETARPESWELLLQALLDAHAASGSGGRFRVERAGEIYHVIPAETRNAAGLWVKTASILDAYITIPEQYLAWHEMIQAICDAVSAAMDVHLWFGTGVGPGGVQSINGPPRERFTVDNERARDVLLRTLQRRNGRLAWRIFQGPGTNSYALNVTGVAGRGDAAMFVEPPHVPGRLPPLQAPTQGPATRCSPALRRCEKNP